MRHRAGGWWRPLDHIPAGAAQGPDVGCAQDSRDDHKPPGSDRGQPLQIFEFDSTDAEDRKVARIRVDGGKIVRADGCVVGFGGCGEDGAVADVVGAFGGGGTGLVGTVGGFADNGTGSGQFAGLADRDVILADMDAVGAGVPGESRVVVDNKWHGGVAAEPGEFTGKGQEAFGRMVFGPQLENPDASGNHEARGAHGVIPRDHAKVQDSVEPCGGKAGGRHVLQSGEG